LAESPRSPVEGVQAAVLHREPVGAGGAVASKDIARADADGYTLLIGGSGPHIMGPAENPNIGYDPVGDFSHIAMIGGESFALSAQASLGVKSFKELIALSNSKAGADQLRAPPARARSASSWSSRCNCARSPTSTTCPTAAARRC
jgi:tripartite-type tricarboxylate transporter receptor subunit TctC